MSKASTVAPRSARASRNIRNGPSPMQLKVLGFLKEARWVLFFALAGWLTLVLFSWHANDPSWSHVTHSNQLQNRGGILGAYTADILLYLFGFSAWLWVVLLAQRVLAGYRRLSKHIRARGEPEPLERVKWEEAIGFILMFAGTVGLESHRLASMGTHLPSHSDTSSGAGGVIGQAWAGLLTHWVGFTGSTLIFIVMAGLGASLFFRFSWFNLAERVGTWLEYAVVWAKNTYTARQDRRVGETAAVERREQVDARHEQIIHASPVRIEPSVTVVQKSERVIKEKQQTLFQDPNSAGHLPEIGLLDPPPQLVETVSPETIEFTSRLIEKKLSDFGVQVAVVAAQAGPVITRYEIEPALGVKGSQIVNLAKDLARALSLVSIRVVETIPGKNLMGLELPNPRRQTVRLSEILGSQTYHASSSAVTMALGKDIAGNPVVADLAKMPHLLVAGTTGSGKSVGINAMILSLLYKADASQTRLILIDPKMLEMSVYEGIPHLLAPVVTDMRQAANALNWCVAEMEKRYRVMSKLGVRNLAGFNSKIRDAAKKEILIPNPFSLTPDAPEPLHELPTIVVVIDELADLMMVVGKKIEELIARLAQKARAAGIHLILATQRPSVDVITGLIKANIPTRIAFQVSSRIDSRTILDQMGAEALLGMGDMLYMPSGTGLPIRVHGAFVSDDEVHRVVNALKAQGEPDYIEGLLEGGVAGETGDGLNPITGLADVESDPMYDQAVSVVLKNRRASISLVQRHLRIGYNRAARLLEQMEKSGVVSTMQSNGNREILVPVGPQDA
jgi:S-DNA-T family DNA segregation ATPase FtsK/SpoIIIE